MYSYIFNSRYLSHKVSYSLIGSSVGVPRRIDVTP